MLERFLTPFARALNPNLSELTPKDPSLTPLYSCHHNPSLSHPGNMMHCNPRTSKMRLGLAGSDYSYPGIRTVFRANIVSNYSRGTRVGE